MKTDEIRRAFDLLRTLTDPRGHDLLDSLETLCTIESQALDAFLETVPEPSNVIPLMKHYAQKVPCS